MAKKRIYLAEQPSGALWELYEDGVPTGKFINTKEIRGLLDRKQYQQFLNGDTIFHVYDRKLSFDLRKNTANFKWSNGKKGDLK